MKLELKHLAAYLPYGIKLEADYIHKGFKTLLVVQNPTNSLRNGLTIPEAIEYNAKPVLRPIEDLKKNDFSDVLGHFTHDYVFILDETNYWFVQKMLELHFDVFGLIPEGLAVDMNTLKAVSGSDI